MTHVIHYPPVLWHEFDQLLDEAFGAGYTCKHSEVRSSNADPNLCRPCAQKAVRQLFDAIDDGESTSYLNTMGGYQGEQRNRYLELRIYRESETWEPRSPDAPNPPTP